MWFSVPLWFEWFTGVGFYMFPTRIKYSLMVLSNYVMLTGTLSGQSVNRFLFLFANLVALWHQLLGDAQLFTVLLPIV